MFHVERFIWNYGKSSAIIETENILMKMKLEGVQLWEEQ